MADKNSEAAANAPFGTVPRRRGWPLALLIALMALWIAALVWMAVTSPARGT